MELTKAIDGRPERGLAIAQSKRLKKQGAIWLVPSQTVDGATYAVKGNDNSCTCPDHVKRPEFVCKHQWAVRYVRRKVQLPNGTVVTSEVMTMRPTYSQNPGYTKAQWYEKGTVRILLNDLCDGLVEPQREGPGRPRIPLRDLVFATAFKVYTAGSARRSGTDLMDAQKFGFLGHVPAHNSIAKFLEDPASTALLRMLVRETASPLADLETVFAIDASGFSTSTFSRWHDVKYKKYEKMFKGLKPNMPIRLRDFDKAHLICGVQTLIVPDVVVTGGKGVGSGDAVRFKELVEATATRFEVTEVSADKAYLSWKNFQACAEVGALPYIPFKARNTGRDGPMIWRRMWHFFQTQGPEFWETYHKRSNVESVFSSIKRLFGSRIWSRTPTARQNEVYCKVLCHNLVVLVHAIYEMDLEPKFWLTPPTAPLPPGPGTEDDEMLAA